VIGDCAHQLVIALSKEHFSASEKQVIGRFCLLAVLVLLVVGLILIFTDN